MLRLPPFELSVPERLEDVLAGIADEPATRLVAGGTDLWPNMKRRHQAAERVISLMGIPGLRGVHGNGELSIGATTRLSEVVASDAVRRRFPALATAAVSISSPPLRNMGTLGGNLCLDTRCTYYNQPEPWRRSIDYCMKEAGSVCWVAPSSPRCWAHSASDGAPVLAALGARAVLASRDGERTVAVGDLFRDDGIDYLEKRPEEVLTRVLLPADSEAGRCCTAFWKLRRRGSIDFAVLSVAVALWLDGGGAVERARIVLGAVGSRPVEAAEASRALVGHPIEEERLGEAARAARKAATPMDNTDFQTQWRGQMAETYTLAALRDAAGLDPGVQPPRHRRF